ncbi:MAG: hypothetical protein WD960_02930 [Gemmatimonadota bacterium]
MAEPSFLAEVRRRRVIPTALFYAAFAWIAIQVVTTLLPVFGGRDVLVRILVVVILAGLPVAIAVSWIFDLTPAGVRRADRGEDGSIRDDGSPTRSGAGTAPGPPSTRWSSRGRRTGRWCRPWSRGRFACFTLPG